MERQVVLEELGQSEDQPEEVAFQQLLKQSCLNHAYGASDPWRARPFSATRQRAWPPSTTGITEPTVVVSPWLLAALSMHCSQTRPWPA